MDTLLDIIGRIAYQTEGDETSYRAMLAPEGVETSDRRFIEEGALEWRDGRLPLMWSDTEMAHGDAVHVGNLENLRKEEVDGVVWVVADVDWDDDTEATEARRLVDEDRLTGISIHMADMDADEDCPDGDLTKCVLSVSHGVIAAATIVAIPAFEDAEIEPIAAAAAPVDLFEPPRAWFDNPNLDGPTPLTITDDGRIYGHLALWDSCHIGFEDICVNPPRDAAEYEEFHAHARVRTEDGSMIPVGVVTVDGFHPDLSLNPGNAARQYDSTATVGGYVRAGDDNYGAWVSGALAPDLAPATVEKLRRLSLSGDWRPRDGRHVLIAALTVPVPGFSIKARVASGEQTAILTLGPAQSAPTDLALVASALESVSNRLTGIESHMTAEWKREQLAKAFAVFKEPSSRIIGPGITVWIPEGD